MYNLYLIYVDNVQGPYIELKMFWNYHNYEIINYCILYAKYYIYVEKLKYNNVKNNSFNLDFLSYLCQLKYNLTMETNICTKRNQTSKFGKF